MPAPMVLSPRTQLRMSTSKVLPTRPVLGLRMPACNALAELQAICRAMKVWHQRNL